MYKNSSIDSYKGRENMVKTDSSSRTILLGALASLLVVICLLVGATVVQAGQPARNNYTALATVGGRFGRPGNFA